MKYPHSIPLWRTNEELLPSNALSRVVLSSLGTRWNDILVEQHNVPSSELADVTYKRHVVVINIGHVGFVDQSHLTRHFKRIFGLPPKRLLNRRRLEIVV